MSNQTIEKQLNLLINLLETLPNRMCNEMEKRDEFRKKSHIENLKSEMEFFRKNNKEINKSIMSGLQAINLDNND